MRPFSVLLLAALTLPLSSCGDENLMGSNPLNNSDFAPELNVDLAQMTLTSSGLYYQDLTAGTGAEAVSGSVAEVHYTGWLINGKKFDSSRDRNLTFQFTIGAQMVIAGWDEGVRGMLVGGVRKLVIPPNLGYGPRGSGNAIPGNATLVFDVELISVQ